MFKDDYDANRTNKTMPGTLEILETFIGYVQLHIIFFYIQRFKTNSFVSERGWAL